MRVALSVTLGVAVALAGLGVSGCARRTGAADGKVHLRLSGYAGNPAETDLMQKLVGDFNRENPDLSVSYEPVPGQYYPKLLTMLVSRTAPDVFYLDVLWFRPFLAKKILLPLNGFIANSSTRTEDFLPELVRSFSQEDQVFGIPKDFNALGLFYNTRMFDEANEPVPDETWDLERLRETARRLTRKSEARYGFALTHDNVDRILPLVRMFGGSLYGPGGETALASREAVAAMRYYVGLHSEDRSAIYPSEIGTNWTGDAFGREHVAMAFEGSWLVPYLKETFPQVQYGVTELPRGPKARANFLFTVAYAIPRSSAHPEAAWRLIEFLTSDRAQAQVTFALPSRTEACARYVEANPTYRPFLAGAKYADPYEFGPKGARVSARVGVAVQEVFLGVKGPEQALEEASRDVDRLQKL